MNHNARNTTQALRWKQGRTFKPTVFFVPEKGGLQNLIGWTVTCEVRDSIGTRWEVTATVAADGMSINLYLDAETTMKWAVGIASIDLRYTDGGDTETTETLQFEVTEAVTTI